MAAGSAVSEPFILRALAAVNARICGTGRVAAGLLLIAMTAIVLTQIVFRYILNDSLVWTEEVSKTLMVWSAFLIAPWAYRYGANVRIEMFVDALPRALRDALHLALNLLVVWILAVLFRESFGLVERGFAVSAASLPIAVGWFLAIVPIAFAAMTLVGIELVVRDVLALLYRDRDFSVPGAQRIGVKEGE